MAEARDGLHGASACYLLPSYVQAGAAFQHASEVRETQEPETASGNSVIQVIPGRPRRFLRLFGSQAPWLFLLSPPCSAHPRSRRLAAQQLCAASLLLKKRDLRLIPEGPAGWCMPSTGPSVLDSPLLENLQSDSCNRPRPSQETWRCWKATFCQQAQRMIESEPAAILLTAAAQAFEHWAIGAAGGVGSWLQAQ